jgi:hypothetical protein
MTAVSPSAPSIDPRDRACYAGLAHTWWDRSGPVRPQHRPGAAIGADGWNTPPL